MKKAIIIMFVVIALFFLMWCSSEKNPEEIIKENISKLDEIKTKEITSISKKQESDAIVLSWLQAEVKTIQWRMNWRNRCIDILSWSLWSINMIDCEAKMQEQSSGNVLQATFQ